MKPPLVRFVYLDSVKKYMVLNYANEKIGIIKKRRVGRFMHWCLIPDTDTFFTNGCLKEITQFITKLYGKKNG